MLPPGHLALTTSEVSPQPQPVSLCPTTDKEGRSELNSGVRGQAYHSALSEPAHSFFGQQLGAEGSKWLYN